MQSRGFVIAAMIASCVTGCGVKREVFDKEVEKNKSLTLKARSLEDQLKDALAKLKDADKSLAEAKSELAGLGDDLSKTQAGAKATLAELEAARLRVAEAAARMKQFRALVARFQKMINDGKLEVQVRNGRMLVKLRDDILFDPGKVDVKPEGHDALAQVAQILKDVPDRDFQVAGHTDNVPIRGRKYRSNWQLSTERALRVARILREAGMPPTHLSAAGFADTVPVADNGTDEGRRKNRRIEIVLEPSISELPNLDSLLKPGG